MKRLFLPLAFLGTISAQSTLTLAGPPSARPGTSISVSLTHNLGPATPPVGFQWNLAAPAGWNPVTGLGLSATAAQKTIACSPDGKICMVYGANNITTIAPGQLATISIAIPSSQAAGSVQLALSNIIAGGPTGNTITTAPALPISIVILAKEDLNGDGAINVADITVIINQSLVTGGTCTTADLNGDGKCDVIDVILLVVKILAP